MLSSRKEFQSPVEKLITKAFQELNYSKNYKVQHCASTVIITKEDITNISLQKEANEPDSLWKVYLNGNYLCGVVSIYDGFVVASLIESKFN